MAQRVFYAKRIGEEDAYGHRAGARDDGAGGEAAVTPAALERDDLNRVNGLEQGFSVLMLAGHVAGIGVVVGALVTGMPALAWVAVAVMFWFMVTAWGRHILFLDNLNGLPDLGAVQIKAPEPLPFVSIIVPARNEAAGIECAARTLAAMDYGPLEVIFVDDHSSDATPSILQSLSNEFPQVRVVAAPEVPDGWTGKTHASWFGVSQCNPAAEWLLFTDARVKFRPHAIGRAIAFAESEHLGFMSGIIRFEGVGMAEELIAVLQNRSLVMSARTFGGGDPAMPFGLGAFTLIRRSLYLATGGHAAVSDHPIEDFMLARSARMLGAQTGVVIASRLLSLRRYQGFKDMRRRVVRLLRLAADDRTGNLIGGMLLGISGSLLPIPVALWAGSRALSGGRPQLAWIALGASALATYLIGTQTVLLARKICLFRSWVAWIYPAGTALSFWFQVMAIAQKVRGTAILWRGRALSAITPVPR
jgi:hypothetical protein